MIKNTNLFLALTAIASLSACDGRSTKAMGNSTEAASATSTAIGTTAKAIGLDFTVTKVATSIQVGPTGAGPKAEAGETFVVVSYTIKNTGSKALPFTDRPALSLVDARAVSYLFES